MNDTYTKTAQDIENEKNSTATLNEAGANKSMQDIPKSTPKVKKQRLNFNTSNVDVNTAGEAYLAGSITNREWSLMSPALRKAVERYAKKNKHKKNTVETATEVPENEVAVVEN